MAVDLLKKENDSRGRTVFAKKNARLLDEPGVQKSLVAFDTPVQ